jgi:hypothetical protein
MGVTAIKSITNTHANLTYRVKNRENSNDPELTIAPGQVTPCNMWIPWCTSEKDFDNHHIQILEVSAGLVQPIAIWQDGDYVRYSKEGVFQPNGNLVLGASYVNGDRSVVISGERNAGPTITFY